MKMAKHDQVEHENIVHQLRSQGWSKSDAIEQADILMSQRIERRIASGRSALTQEGER